MIWNDKKIKEWAEQGNITPYDERCINPASIDLKLGNKYRYIRDKSGWSDDIEFEELILHPHDFILCHSSEFTKIPTNCAVFLMLKSSMGRKGIEHLHAGFGDPGFEGEWTFELYNCMPDIVKLRAGQRILQLVFFDCYEPGKDYSKTGRYQNQTGPTKSK